MFFIRFSLILRYRGKRKIPAGISRLNLSLMENTLLDKRVDHIVLAAMTDLLQFLVIDPPGRMVSNDLRFFIKLIAAERAGVDLTDQREPIVLLDNLNR